MKNIWFLTILGLFFINSVFAETQKKGKNENLDFFFLPLQPIKIFLIE